MSRAVRPTLRVLVASGAAAAMVLSGCSTEQPDIEKTPGDSSGTVTESASGSPAESPSGTPEPSTTTMTATPTEEATTVFVKIGPDSVTPIAERVDLSVGAPLALDITASRTAELHVHSSPEREIEVEPGHSTLELSFDKPGTVDIEEHASDSLILRVLVH
jgi:hypothetical protein